MHPDLEIDKVALAEMERLRSESESHGTGALSGEFESPSAHYDHKGETVLLAKFPPFQIFLLFNRLTNTGWIKLSQLLLVTITELVCKLQTGSSRLNTRFTEKAQS